MAAAIVVIVVAVTAAGIVTARASRNQQPMWVRAKKPRPDRQVDRKTLDRVDEDTTDAVVNIAVGRAASRLSSHLTQRKIK